MSKHSLVTVKNIARRLVVEEIRAGRLPQALSIARLYTLEEEIELLIDRLIDQEISAGQLDEAHLIARKSGRSAPVRKTAKALVDRALQRKHYFKAAQIAKTYDLVEEMKDSAKNGLKQSIAKSIPHLDLRNQARQYGFKLDDIAEIVAEVVAEMSKDRPTRAQQLAVRYSRKTFEAFDCTF